MKRDAVGTARQGVSQDGRDEVVMYCYWRRRWSGERSAVFGDEAS
jgi:hypothetical protein